MKKIILTAFLLLISIDCFTQESQVKYDSTISGTSSVVSYDNAGRYYGLFFTMKDTNVTLGDTVSLYMLVPVGNGRVDTTLLSLKNMVDGTQDSIACSKGRYSKLGTFSTSIIKYLVQMPTPFKVIAILRNRRTLISGIKTYFTWQGFSLKTN